MSEDIFKQLEKLKELDEQRKKARKNDKDLTAEITPLMASIFQHFLDNEIQGLKYKGKNFFPKISTLPDVQDRERLKALLMEEGLNKLISVNANSLRSHINEEIKMNNGELPKKYEGILTTIEKESIGIIKA